MSLGTLVVYVVSDVRIIPWSPSEEGGKLPVELWLWSPEPKAEALAPRQRRLTRALPAARQALNKQGQLTETKAVTFILWNLSQTLRYAGIHKPVSPPPALTGIFTTAGGVITRAQACNVFNLSTALFALYILDEAFSASSATYRDEMLALKDCFLFFFACYCRR